MSKILFTLKKRFDLKLLKGTVTDSNFALDINCRGEPKKSRSRFVFVERLVSIHVLKAPRFKNWPKVERFEFFEIAIFL